MNKVASQNTSLTIVYSIVYSDADQRKHQSFASLAFGWGIHRRPVNSPHKWPVTRKMFPFDDVIMSWQTCVYDSHKHHRIENCSIFIEYNINSISIGVWRWDNKKFIVLIPVIHTRQLNISSIPNAKWANPYTYFTGYISKFDWIQNIDSVMNNYNFNTIWRAMWWKDHYIWDPRIKCMLWWIKKRSSVSHIIHIIVIVTFLPVKPQSGGSYAHLKEHIEHFYNELSIIHPWPRLIWTGTHVYG